MKLLILANSHLDCNTGVHIVNLAGALAPFDVQCMVCMPHEADVARSGRLDGLGVIDAESLVHSLPFAAPPDLILMWTPREANRRALQALRSRFDVPYVVHFEDNEFHITEVAFGMPHAEFEHWREFGRPDIQVPDHLSNPALIESIVAGSVGVTVLVEELLEVIPGSKPALTFWPGYDESLTWGMDADADYKRSLGLADDEYVVAYTGNQHPANADEVRSLYLAIALLNRRGFRVRLLRTGQDYALLADHGEALLRSHAIELGVVPRSELPRVLSIADVLVQPGVPDAFNIYRFPSKLPEFLASRRPVILPGCNIGSYLTHGHDACVLPACRAQDIAVALEELLPDAQRRRSLGHFGALFASRHLRWHVAAQRVAEFLHASSRPRRT